MVRQPSPAAAPESNNNNNSGCGNRVQSGSVESRGVYVTPGGCRKGRGGGTRGIFGEYGGWDRRNRRGACNVCCHAEEHREHTGAAAAAKSFDADRPQQKPYIPPSGPIRTQGLSSEQTKTVEGALPINTVGEHNSNNQIAPPGTVYDASQCLQTPSQHNNTFQGRMSSRHDKKNTREARSKKNIQQRPCKAILLLSLPSRNAYTQSKPS